MRTRTHYRVNTGNAAVAVKSAAADTVALGVRAEVAGPALPPPAPVPIGPMERGCGLSGISGGTGVATVLTEPIPPPGRTVVDVGT
jgi:hypothetical protein